MMNLELLFWASKNGGEKSLDSMARSHALATMQNHFRPDGSTYHVISYDSTTGAVLAKETHQGYAHESVWSRGQAWAIYGFTMTYRETGDERFLETAKRAADYFLGHLPDDGVPYWDFLAPDLLLQPRDVSAAAIASSALFELSGFVDVRQQRKAYRSAAERILSSLCQAPYLSERSGSSGILNHAVGNLPARTEIDVSLIYADYFFIESIVRYTHMQNR
jgi:unsaturated chondroitin disaccharide hydrolase